MLLGLRAGIESFPSPEIVEILFRASDKLLTKIGGVGFIDRYGMECF